MPHVSWSIEALDDLVALIKLQPKAADRIREEVRDFARSGRGDVKKLRAESDLWRLRSGDWRIILQRAEGGRYTVREVRNRRDAYND